MVFFFFQAEDGIRDSSVTGVQTCALPIFMRTRWRNPRRGRGWLRRRAGRRTGSGRTGGRRRGTPHRDCPARTATDRKSVVEGKSVDLGGRRIIKKKKE